VRDAIYSSATKWSNDDLPRNPMKIEQRIGRIQCIGQENEVRIYNMCTIGSIEDYILEIPDRKIKLWLIGAILIRTPAVKLFCEATVGRCKRQFTLFYNPINKSIDPLVCEGCGNGRVHIQFCDQLRWLCPRCGQSCPACHKKR